MHAVLVGSEGETSGPFRCFELENGEVLFEGLERLGLRLPHGCLAGACGACKVVVLEGDENLEPSGVIEDNTLNSIYQDNPRAKNKVIRLSCRAKVLGSVKLRPFK